ncbi:hypothetical protein GCK72_009129 [Caenorhabditis remanei]|uniref:Uncharacterized protein n=1 Tax=Caenorhabditis remanei TaxID=31234 RepID=A0A6A5GZG4_CAERE|nr:hypothetical protein GCK72_009129 [Caenorhabditis remanei]KAF1760878.1 hypothetical protein GCK72_009129 [Caenorhabditis remanei]
MNILALLVFCLLAITSPVIARGRRCHSSTQCDYESVCYEGYCYTIDEMFDNCQTTRNELFLCIELVEHLVDGITVSLVADGFIVALSARMATTSTSDDWRRDGQEAEDEESQNIHSE